MQDPTVMRISLHKDPMYMLYIKDPKTEYMQDPTVIVFRRPNKRWLLFTHRPKMNLLCMGRSRPQLSRRHRPSHWSPRFLPSFSRASVEELRPLRQQPPLVWPVSLLEDRPLRQQHGSSPLPWPVSLVEHRLLRHRHRLLMLSLIFFLFRRFGSFFIIIGVLFFLCLFSLFGSCRRFGSFGFLL